MNLTIITLLLTVYFVNCQPFNFANSLVNPNQDPVITFWKKATGYSPFLPNVVADINKIQYSSKFVYVSFSSLPSYKIGKSFYFLLLFALNRRYLLGPWSGNPNQAQDQKMTFKLPRVPAVKMTAKTQVGAGLVYFLCYLFDVFLIVLLQETLVYG